MTKPADNLRCLSNKKKSMDDNKLIALYLSGNEAALTSLVERYQKEIYRFVYRHIGNEADAQDVTQRVFVLLFLKAQQFQGKSTFKTWLYQIALNQCKNLYRSNDRRKEVSTDDESIDCTMEDKKVDDIATFQRRKILKQAIQKLPEKQRLTMQLRVYHECTFVEIADIMASSVGTVKASYHQAVQSLTKKLGEDEYESAEV